MKLYNYFRSSASFRVRIALNLKGLPYDYVAVHLAKGEHKQDDYAAVSADQLVPMRIERPDSRTAPEGPFASNALLAGARYRSKQFR